MDKDTDDTQITTKHGIPMEIESNAHRVSMDPYYISIFDQFLVELADEVSTPKQKPINQEAVKVEGIVKKSKVKEIDGKIHIDMRMDMRMIVDPEELKNWETISEFKDVQDALPVLRFFVEKGGTFTRKASWVGRIGNMFKKN